MADNYTLIFDVGNTLAPFNLRELTKIQNDLTAFICSELEVEGNIFLDAWKKAREEDMSHSIATGIEHDFTARLVRVLKSLGLNSNSNIAEKARLETIKSFIRHTEINPRVTESLLKLAPEYKLGVLSNYLLAEPIHELLKKGGIYNCFET